MTMARDGRTKDYDPYLLEKIQPQGGITFRDPAMSETGTGYETCLHIYDYPNSLDDYWMAKICNIKNAVTVIDMATNDKNEIKKNINRSMKEQKFRAADSKNYSDLRDAQLRYQELQNLYEEIEALEEIVKKVHTRIFLADRTKADLEESVKNVQAQLSSDEFNAAIFLNEQKSEWTSLFKPYTRQAEERFFILGQPLTGDALAIGYPYHYSNLCDKNGMFLGQTPCDGDVLFNLILKSKSRLYYNFLCVGTMGSGKSTLLKKMLLQRAITGDYVRTFDISGEFTRLTKYLGGKVLKLDGTSGILNPLEILQGGDDDIVSFTRHISKVSTIYKFLVGGQADVEEIMIFEDLLRELYRKFGFEIKNGRMTEQIVGLPPNRYPIFEDMLEFINEKIESIQQQDHNDVNATLISKKVIMLDKIKNVVRNIVRTYGNLFNGYTSIENIQDEQIVTFDISALKDMKAEVFDSEIFNMISLCWDNCVTNGKLMMQGLKEEKVKVDDVVHTLILIDESHRWVNTKKQQALELISVYFREARKYFGGIGLASHNARDFVPEGTESAVDKMKTLFELSQYKFVFHQDESSSELLQKIFRGSFTASQIDQISQLNVGENILSIASDQTIRFKVYLSKAEEELFEGGI